MPCNILSPSKGPATCITNQLRGVSNISTLLPHNTRSLALVSGDVLPPAEGSVTNFTDKGLYSSNISTSSILFLLCSLCCALMQSFLAHRFPFSPFLRNCKPVLFLDVKILEVFPNLVPPLHLYTMSWPSLWEPPKEDLLCKAVIIHSCHVAQPTQPLGSDHIFKGFLHTKLLPDLCTCDAFNTLLGSCDPHYPSQTLVVERFQLLCCSSLVGPRLSSIEKDPQHYGTVHHPLGCQ